MENHNGVATDDKKIEAKFIRFDRRRMDRQCATAEAAHMQSIARQKLS